MFIRFSDQSLIIYQPIFQLNKGVVCTKGHILRDTEDFIFLTEKTLL